MNFKDLPEVNFVDFDAETIFNDSKKICEQLLGRNVEKSDPLFVFLKSMIAVILQQRALIDSVAKDNLLAYAKDSALDHMGALVGVYRLKSSNATCTCQVSLSAPVSRAVTIKKGTRVNAGDDVNFALDDDLTFLAGQTSLTAKFTCLESGEIGNNYAVGELDKIVDPQAFLAEIINITKSEGGADVESDDHFRERIRIAPESFSTAGATGAYEFYTKKASSLIEDVFVTSENPGEVDVYPLLKNGELPDAELLDLILQTLNDREIRPLTDLVFVKVPEIIEYDIDLEYWISLEDSASAFKIQTQVEKAVDDFILWQKSRLGRDINKTELEYRIRAAGAKRVEIAAPVFTFTPENAVAVNVNKNVVYNGLEER